MPTGISKFQDSDIIIRNDIRPGDIGAIIRLHGTLYADAFGFDHTFEPYVAKPLADFVLDRGEGDQIWIVEKDRQVLGSVAIVRVSDHTAQLRWLLLHPDIRGQGIGHILVAKAIDFSRTCGYQSVFLWTIDFLTQARKVYASAGFKFVKDKTGESWGRVLTEQRYELIFDWAVK